MQARVAFTGYGFHRSCYCFAMLLQSPFASPSVFGCPRVLRRCNVALCVVAQDLAKEEAAQADCERRLAAVPYDAEAAAALETTVTAEQTAVQAASDRVSALSSKLAGERSQQQ